MEYRKIRGYGGRYLVSDQGDIISVAKRQKLTPKNDPGGRHNIDLYKNGVLKRYAIHRIVARAFISNPYRRKEVHHIDENSHNNQWANLAWVTRLQNQRLGTCIERIAAGKRVRIDQLTTAGEYVRTWEGLRLTEKLGFNHGRVYLCCIGKAKTHGGFKWRYKK